MILKTQNKQHKLISILQRQKNAYQHKVKKIKTEETHISWILLTGSYAYKIKKALKFGQVLDFSTLQLRKKICQNEVSLNKILCHKMYLGVVKIVQDPSFSSFSNNDGAPLRVANLDHKGKALEYAVKMIEIPQQYRMDKLLKAQKLNKKAIDQLTKILVNFHKTTPTGAKIRICGRPKSMLEKIDENFKTLGKLQRIDSKYQVKLVSFIKDNQKLLCKRIRQNKIRDIHGDLYLKNIFIVNGTKKARRWYLYDRIEFNDFLRYADVAEDVAHLSMDLDFHKRCDLRKHFISQYIIKSKDADLEHLIYFLMCYKACMRAKVSLFQAQSEKNHKKKTALVNESKNLFRLAESYFGLF